MPFTFSHPAIVLPLYRLVRHWVSLTGLIVGSIVPDFEYFIRMRSGLTYSHTLPGLVWFNLPLGVLLCFIFHNLVRNSLFSHLPYVLNSRLANFKRFNWNKHFRKNWYLVIFSILIGAASHLLWDDFTHENGYIIKVANLFDKNLNPTDPDIPEYETLQVLSSVIGGLIVLYAILQLPVTDRIKRPFYFKYWASVGIMMLAMMAIRFYTDLNIDQYREIIVNLISSGLIAIIIVSLLLRKQYYR